MIEIREMSARTTTIAEENKKIVEGVVNKPAQKSEILHDKNGKQFVEMIMPNAFAEAIEQAENIRLLLNHDKSKILADTKSGSLIIEEKNGQVTMKAELVETSDGKDAYELVKKQLSGGLSFGFTTIDDEWQEVDGMYQRKIKKMILNEISIVSDPAYSQSSVEARSIEVPTKITIEKEVQTKMETLMKETRNTTLSSIIKGETRALQTTVEGAAVIPTQVANTIVEKAQQISGVFDKVTKLKSESGHLKVARENSNTVATFLEEGETAIEQGLDLKYVQLTQKRVAAPLSLSNQLMNDSAVDIDSYVERKLAKSVANAMDKAILTGNGIKDFKGVTTDIDVPKIQMAAITYDSLLELSLQLPQAYLQGAMFVLNKTVFNAVAKLKDGNGHFYMQNGVVNGVVTATLFGYQVAISDYLTDTNPILFGNFEEGYTVLVKQESQMQVVNDTTQALRGSRLFLYDLYVDGAVTNPEAFAVATITVA